MTTEEYKLACLNLSSRELKPTVPEVIPLVRFYCASEEAVGLGGCLHIFVEDGNCEDGHIQFCRHESTHKGELGALICDVLLKMSMTQRRAIYGAGYVAPIRTEATPEQQDDPQPEKYFPIEMLEKISSGLPPIELENLFTVGNTFRKENVLFKVDSINNKKHTVVLKVAGLFGAVEGVE